MHLPVTITITPVQQGQELMLCCQRPQKRAAKAVAAITNLDIAKKAKTVK